MSKFLSFITVLLVGLTASASKISAGTATNTSGGSNNGLPIVLLTDRNTLVLRNVIDGQSVTAVQQKAIKLSQGLAASEGIFLFLDTPGGEVGAGNELITALKGLPQQVHTVTSFAASMGFITVQSLGNRYILPNGILMSHRAAGGARGQIPGELNTRVQFYTNMLDAQDATIAARVGMTKEAYQNLIRDEYWIEGGRAVQAKMADRTVLVRCDRSLTEGKTTETINTFFGAVKVTYSNCPLVSAPIEVSFSDINLSSYDDRDKAIMVEVRKTVLTLIYDKRSFYHDYILTNKAKKVLP